MNSRATDPHQASLAVLRKLREEGFKAYFAGGCVRDMLMGRVPKDYDVVTDALPDQVRALFSRSKAVGQQFGVILVRKSGVDVEVATFRSDEGYSDGRRPDRVTFTNEVEDARRRDFTVNGMFYDPLTGQVIDHVGGQADLRARRLRTIGDPSQRFAEDHLRMLRAVRFAVALDFALDRATHQAIREHASRLRGISAERIWMELERMLTNSGRHLAWRLLCETGLVDHLAESWTFAEAEAVRIERRLAALPEGGISVGLAVAGLTCEHPVRSVRGFCRALRLSNDDTDAACWLVRELPLVLGPAADELAQRRLWRAHEYGGDLMELARVECVARERSLDAWRRVSAAFLAIDPDGATPPPLVTGDDLTNAGYVPGPAFGRVLARVYRAQLNEQVHTREEAMKMAEHLLHAPAS